MQKESIHIQQNPPLPVVSMRILWCTSDYNDEELLLNLRINNPQLSWRRIYKIYNDAVPSRPRTFEAIVTKWKFLKPFQNRDQNVQNTQNFEGTDGSFINFPMMSDYWVS